MQLEISDQGRADHQVRKFLESARAEKNRDRERAQRVGDQGEGGNRQIASADEFEFPEVSKLHG